MNQSPRPSSVLVPRPTSAVAGLMLLAGLISGCGSQAYESRLEETRRYFEYRQKVDQALDGRAWSQFGIELRVPSGFVEIPTPAEGEPDLRQPPYFNAPLPGLLGAWQGTVKIDIPDSEVRELPSYLFVCTNHDRFLNRLKNPTVLPGELFRDVSSVVADSLGFERDSNVNPWVWDEMRVPRGTAYVPRKTYDLIHLDNEIELGGVKVPADVHLHRYFNGEIQFVLISVVPAVSVLDRNERIGQSIDLAMETLTMSDQVPTQHSTAAPTSGGGF